MGKIFGAAQKVQGIFGGGVLLASAFALMWAGTASDVATDKQLSRAVAEAVEIDTNSPDPTLNGKLVIAAGIMRTDQAFEDDFVTIKGALIVQRRVEMMQWVESTTPTTAQPTYSLEWSEEQIDFFKFAQPQGHENPLMQVGPVRYQSPSVRFGRFDGSRLLSSIDRLDRVELSSDQLKDPKYRIVDNKIVVPRGLGITDAGLGDMRVWYEILPQGDYTVLTMQNDERNLVGAAPSVDLFIRKGALTAADFEREMQEEAGESSIGTFYLGGLLSFIGALSLMMPHAKRFDLRPRLNVQGALAVVVVSAGCSCLVMALFFLLSLTRGVP